MNNALKHLPRACRATPEHRPAPAPQLSSHEIMHRWGIDCEDVTDETAADSVDDDDAGPVDSIKPTLRVFDPDRISGRKPR